MSQKSPKSRRKPRAAPPPPPETPRPRYPTLRAREPATSWRAMLYWVGGVWLVSRAVLSVVGVTAREWIGQLEHVGNIQWRFDIGSGSAWLDIWSAWDSRWYYQIAELGYVAERGAGDYATYAFFPLYPWLVRYVGLPFDDSYLGGLLVSNVAILIGACLLYRWVELEKDRSTAKKAVLFLFLFPTAYTFSCLLSESLFFTLSIGAWYCARRENWLLAGLLGGLGALTRSLGVLLVLPLALEYLRQRDWRMNTYNPFILWSSFVRALDLRVLWIGLVPAGLLAFVGMCWYLTDNPFAFIDIQEAWVTRGQGVNPLTVLFFSVLEWDRSDGNFGLTNASFGRLYGAIAAVTVVVLLLCARKRIAMPLLAWSLVYLLVMLSSSHQVTWSMPRYLVVIFPLYLIFAGLSVRRAWFWLVALLLIALQVMTFAFWTNAYGISQ